MVEKILLLEEQYNEVADKVTEVYNEIREMEKAHPRACKKNPKYNELNLRYYDLRNQREDIRNQQNLAAKEYMKRFELVNPLEYKVDLTPEEKVLKAIYKDSQYHKAQELEIDFIFTKDVPRLCVALNQYNIKRVALISHCTDSLEILANMLDDGWKVTGKYERVYPQIDARLNEILYFYKDHTVGILLEK